MQNSDPKHLDDNSRSMFVSNVFNSMIWIYLIVEIINLRTIYRILNDYHIRFMENC